MNHTPVETFDLPAFQFQTGLDDEIHESIQEATIFQLLILLICECILGVLFVSMYHFRTYPAIRTLNFHCSMTSLVGSMILSVTPLFWNPSSSDFQCRALRPFFVIVGAGLFIVPLIIKTWILVQISNLANETPSPIHLHTPPSVQKRLQSPTIGEEDTKRQTNPSNSVSPRSTLDFLHLKQPSIALQDCMSTTDPRHSSVHFSPASSGVLDISAQQQQQQQKARKAKLKMIRWKPQKACLVICVGVSLLIGLIMIQVFIRKSKASEHLVIWSSQWLQLNGTIPFWNISSTTMKLSPTSTSDMYHWSVQACTPTSVGWIIVWLCVFGCCLFVWFVLLLLVEREVHPVMKQIDMMKSAATVIILLVLQIALIEVWQDRSRAVITRWVVFGLKKHSTLNSPHNDTFPLLDALLADTQWSDSQLEFMLFYARFLFMCICITYLQMSMYLPSIRTAWHQRKTKQKIAQCMDPPKLQVIQRRHTLQAMHRRKNSSLDEEKQVEAPVLETVDSVSVQPTHIRTKTEQLHFHLDHMIHVNKEEEEEEESDDSVTLPDDDVLCSKVESTQSKNISIVQKNSVLHPGHSNQQDKEEVEEDDDETKLNEEEETGHKTLQLCDSYSYNKGDQTIEEWSPLTDSQKQTRQQRQTRRSVISLSPDQLPDK